MDLNYRLYEQDTVYTDVPDTQRLLGPDPDRVMEQYEILVAEKNAEGAHEAEADS